MSVDKRAARAFRKIVGRKNVLTAAADMLLYGYDSSTVVGYPDAVIFPHSTEEVSRTVRVCAERGIPFVARGAGTDLSGGSAPVQGGVVIVLTRMNRVLEIDVENQSAIVEAGVVNLDLQDLLKPHNLQFCPDPASQKVSTVGGNVAENAGGPRCLKYGVTANHVLGLTVVLPSGEVRRFGGKAIDYPGYDLVGLMVGSEGTLGIVTEAVLRLRPLPEDVQTVLAIFETLEDAGEAVTRIIAKRIIPAAMEIMDRNTIGAVEASFPSGLPLDVEAVLLIELDGLREALDRQAGECAQICRDLRARQVQVGRTPEEREQLWSARRSAYGATARLSAGILVNDATVPRSQIPEVLRKIQGIEDRHGLRIAKLFHAGDGNLHCNILYNRNEPDEFERAETATEEIFLVCAEAGGTITGEHGVGAEKARFMRLLYSHNDIEAQRKLKSVFDPANLSNPGKVFPEIDAMGTET